jgi:predicted CopG family antitoxin
MEKIDKFYICENTSFHLGDIMTNLTLSIPDELHKKMKKHSEIRWSEVVRKIITEKIEHLEIMDRLTKNSKLKNEDIELISKNINSNVAKQLGLK